ncbi:GNAT family N-acetyltransferase [Plantactinospora endophytica]|uniref:N-acetyltransferase n=1 Tax=Plantactinospora endophytica TaxID=673535 RepID=A0ABQ4E5I7_9ACTN|nr:GNAT family N-acetyltransferase [Plantactinospora endophytica]GIG89962.1 N-acetyltransferase [Plantactinospora endophytica]
MTTDGVTICSATAADAPAIAGIFGYYVINSVATFEETPPTAADWWRRLDALTARGLPFLAAKTGDEVNGFAYAAPWRPKPAYRQTVEDTIYLAPEVTGKGVGRALLAALLQRCRERDVRQVVAVIADTGDPASTALHRSAGFAQVGRLVSVGYKHGRWIDTVLMQRDLAAPDHGGR